MISINKYDLNFTCLLREFLKNSYRQSLFFIVAQYWQALMKFYVIKFYFMKKKMSIIVAALFLSAGVINAQSMKNTLKIGAIAGAAVPKGNVAAGAGLDVAYQNLVTPNFGLGIASGYQHYFGRTNKINSVDVKNNDFGVVPVAGVFRYYPQAEGIYVGTDLGYGVIVGDKQVTDKLTPNADRPTGGLYLKPEIGYHNRNWNIFAHYTKTFTGNTGKVGDQKFNAGMIGVGLAYNIGLGR